MKKKPARVLALSMVVLSLSGAIATAADARRGGSFGSRGSRTYSAPRQTDNSPRYVPPVERSMAPRSPAQAAPGYNPAAAQNQAARPGGSRFGGFGGGLLGGLIAGGLLGHFLGGGWGQSGSGMFAALIQIAVIGGLLWLVIGFFRRRRQPQAAPVMGGSVGDFSPSPSSAGPWGGVATPQAPQPVADQGADLAITTADQRDFEQLLTDVQDAFGREDYARLRELATPEIMSYLSEELSRNATHGLRNEVTDTRLIDAEVSEAWSEAGADYATIAMRYESRDVMRDRATGALAQGSRDALSETLEYWTFARGVDRVWKLSAIQEA
ncbi:TIM44-like domain-containing protein [uncultured Sphingomonas sp.]|uniref:Tim44 domain-containing protein n=1 Tax=uncultured Sphingomonas sp. TaxID=158754 RepID=UPI002630B8BF|nr:TIM44-like domain-containing protein [uncultured Sphingomonas sp.]